MKKIKEIFNHNWTITLIGGLIVTILGGVIVPIKCSETSKGEKNEESIIVYSDEEIADEFTEIDAIKKARLKALYSLLSNYSDEYQKNIVRRYKVHIIDTTYKTSRGTWAGKCKYSFDEKYLKSH